MAQVVTFWKLIDKQLVKPRLVLLASLDKRLNKVNSK
jgi:hypothetical protein